jgi:protein TonB
MKAYADKIGAYTAAALLHGAVIATIMYASAQVTPPLLTHTIIPLHVVQEVIPPPEVTTKKQHSSDTASPKPISAQSAPHAIPKKPIKPVASAHTESVFSHKVQQRNASPKANPTLAEKNKENAAMTMPQFTAAYLHNPAPDYPAMARRQGMEGRVLLKVAVTAQGKAAQVLLHRSSGFPLLDNAARKAVQRWQFVPAKRGDKAVYAEVVVPVQFKLN